MEPVHMWRDTFRLPRRPREAHKGDFGRVYILAGSVGYTGAPVFAAMAVWLHGRAGDLAAGELGEYAMTPTDLLAYLPRALIELSE